MSFFRIYKCSRRISDSRRTRPRRHRLLVIQILDRDRRRSGATADAPRQCARRADGAGASYEIVRNLLRDDAAALNLLDKAMQRPHGGDRKSEAAIKIDNVNLETKTPNGNSADAGLRRLRKAAT